LPEGADATGVALLALPQAPFTGVLLKLTVTVQAAVTDPVTNVLASVLLPPQVLANAGVYPVAGDAVTVAVFPLSTPPAGYTEAVPLPPLTFAVTL
jgi:hypothetical protein